MTTATKKTTAMCDCPKCNGSGFLRQFAGIANGVCFTCAGSGKVKAGRFKPAPPLSDYARKCYEFIINATSEQIEKMTYAQLHKSLSIACCGRGNQEYPGLKNIWEGKFREAFNAAQEERIANYPKY